MNTPDTVTLLLDHTQFNRPWTKREHRTCDTECGLCGRPISNATAWMARPHESSLSQITFGPIAGLVGVRDPGEWAIVIGPTCAKRLPTTHRMLADDVWNTPMENQ